MGCRGDGWVRNTPAGAGKSLTIFPFISPPWKHPRGCGEESFSAASSWAERETPPRVRGRATRRGRPRTSCRNTPAGAGKSAGGSTQHVGHKKHPRGCGEEWSCPPPGREKSETPPRVRGRAADFGLRRFRLKNTPAGAGKRIPPPASSCKLWKHPRGCGEEFPGWKFCFTGKETPPRVRGRELEA